MLWCLLRVRPATPNVSVRLYICLLFIPLPPQSVQSLEPCKNRQSGFPPLLHLLFRRYRMHLGSLFWVLFTNFGKFSQPIVSYSSLSFSTGTLSRCKVSLVILSSTLHKLICIYLSVSRVLNNFILSVCKRCNSLFRCFLCVGKAEAWIFIVLHLKKFC